LAGLGKAGQAFAQLREFHSFRLVVDFQTMAVQQHRSQTRELPIVGYESPHNSITPTWNAAACPILIVWDKRVGYVVLADFTASSNVSPKNF
jgi:hypothetical protein